MYEQTGASAPKNHHLQFDASLGQIYKIWIVNFLLNILTLGIYSFWGKTRIRRYVMSSFKLGNDRFEFTGTGKEIFFAFIKAVIVILIILAPMYFLYQETVTFAENNPELIQKQAVLEQKVNEIQFNPQKLAQVDPVEYQELQQQLQEVNTTISMKMWDENPTIFIGGGAYFFLFVFFMPMMARYGVLKYQFGHTRWRSIRGHLAGSAFAFPFVVLFHAILIAVSLTLWLPFAQIMLTKYKLKRTYFGNIQADFEPQYGKLFWSHIVTMLLFIPTLGISRFWYRANVAKMHVNFFQLANLKFESDITGGQLFALKFINAIITIVTLGLGRPIVLHRNMEFFAEHTKLVGDIEQMSISQSAAQAPKLGEGVSHWFDIGARFPTGYFFLYF